MQVIEFRDYLRSLPISQIISKYIDTKKRGQNHEAVCPFHNDTNPSLKINDNMGIYKCFVCGESGDSIKFVQQYRNLNFIECLKELSEQFNITLEVDEKRKEHPKFEMARRILKASQEIYFNLPRKTNNIIFNKFLKNRNIDSAAAEKFGLGFINDQSILTNFLLKKQKEKPEQKIIDIAVEIGIIKKSNQGLYDTFRNRIMFPISNLRGQVVGFGSRAIEDKQLPKYLNSGDSFIFNKSKLLYGLNLAKKTIHESDSIILTEGYMDTLSLHQFDFNQAVAIMGIAMSTDKARQICNYTQKVYLGLDNDQAGFIASKRINQSLLAQKVIPLKIDYSPHNDPDDFLNEMGRIEFLKRMEVAKPFVDELIDIETAQNFGANTDLKIKALNLVMELLAPLQDDLRAHERVIRAAKHLGLSSSPESIIEKYKEYLKNNKKKSYQNSKYIEPKNEKSVHPQPEEESIQPERIAQVPELTFTPCKIDTWIMRSILQIPSLSRLESFTEILDFVKNIETKRFVSYWGLQEISEIKEESLAKSLHSIFDKEEFSQEFKNFVYSTTFSFTKTDTAKTKQYVSELKNKVLMESLVIKRKVLKNQRSQVIKEEDLIVLDDKIMNISKEISELKIQN